MAPIIRIVPLLWRIPLLRVIHLLARRLTVVALRGVSVILLRRVVALAALVVVAGSAWGRRGVRVECAGVVVASLVGGGWAHLFVISL